MEPATIRFARPDDRLHLARMRALLWPEWPAENHAKEVDAILSGRFGTLPLVILVAESRGEPVGFLEVGLRSHADGCDPARPVGFLEGWFVEEAWRNQGIGKALMTAAEDWARSQGCREMASDTWIGNELSQRAHEALGFEVVDRCVNYRKKL